MRDRRPELQDILEEICPRVYFQPPESIKMQYPAIVYARDYGDAKHADNVPYVHNVRYEVKVISRNPDEPIVLAMRELSRTAHISHYVADTLNHDVFTIYH